MEPFKNLLDEDAIKGMAGHLERAASDFYRDGFVAFATDGLDSLELKQRSARITDGLEQFLPASFPAAAKILVASLDPRTDFSIGEMEVGLSANGIRGWPVMPMADYVARHGQDHLDLSLNTLREMTMQSSSELAIRPFIEVHENVVMERLMEWTDDQNHHVRRLVSEGTRPRLPWATRLQKFVEDPSPILPLLERLKDDEEEYVRRSVANNLNDISKDHADLVAEVAKRWMKGATKDRARLVRHALRSLIKVGHSGALKALGYSPPRVALSRFKLLTPEVTLGGTLEFVLDISSAGAISQPLIIDYVIRHLRANGKTTPKVFKWKDTVLKAGASLQSKKSHPIRPITTRRYYSGKHHA